MRNDFKKLIYLIVASGVSTAMAGSYEDFFLAVNRDDGDTVASLVQRGFDPNSRDPQGQTALHLALRDQSARTAIALWRSTDLDVNALNGAGETPLMLAALKGELDWAQRLLTRGARLHQEGWSPVHYAATGPEVKLLQLLVERGAPLDARSPNGTTPLMMAARYGTIDGVTYLLARGANTSLKNDLGLDAADFAKAGGKEMLVARLRGAAAK